MHRRLAAAVTLSATLLLGACTDDAPKPPAPPSSGPTVASSTPSPSTPPPSQPNQQQTIAAAIEKAYKIQFDEVNRLDMRGGTTRLTPTLMRTTSGQHRKNVLTALSGDKKAGVHQVGRGTLIGIAVGAGPSSKRNLTACEDYSHVKWLKRNGSELDVQQPLRYVQHAIAKKGTDGNWRVDYVKTDKVKHFRTAVCDGDKV